MPVNEIIFGEEIKLTPIDISRKITKKIVIEGKNGLFIEEYTSGLVTKIRVIKEFRSKDPGIIRGLVMDSDELEKIIISYNDLKKVK